MTRAAVDRAAAGYEPGSRSTIDRCPLALTRARNVNAPELRTVEDGRFAYLLEGQLSIARSGAVARSASIK
jgi:hypothetical protein